MGLGYKFGLTRLPYPPYSITIEATNRCNFKCIFCPQSGPHHKDKRPLGDLSVDGFKEFIRQVKELGTGNNKISICLDGEPLLNGNFPEFIRISNENKLVPRFSTNGKFLTREMIDELIHRGQFIVAIDFASKKEFFEGPRGKDGDFEVLRENLRYLVEQAHRNKNIYVEIHDTSTFSGADPSESLECMKSLIMNGVRPKNVTCKTKQFHNFLGHVDIPCKDKNGKIHRSCPYPWYQFAVTWNGDAVICCRDTGGKTILGNIFEKDICDIWNNEPYREIRELHRGKLMDQIPSCQKCDLPFLNGNCRWSAGYLIDKIKFQ